MVNTDEGTHCRVPGFSNAIATDTAAYQVAYCNIHTIRNANGGTIPSQRPPQPTFGRRQQPAAGLLCSCESLACVTMYLTDILAVPASDACGICKGRSMVVKEGVDVCHNPKRWKGTAHNLRKIAIPSMHYSREVSLSKEAWHVALYSA
jgi:hypothetical protein